MAMVERVLELYREQYFDLNLRHFHEKLNSQHQIPLSYSWVKGIVQGAGPSTTCAMRGQRRRPPIIIGDDPRRDNSTRYSGWRRNGW